MLILMQSDHTKKQLKDVLAKVKSLKLKPHVIPGKLSVAVGITGNSGALDPHLFDALPGVREAVRVSKSYKLAGRDFQHHATVVGVAGTAIRALLQVLAAIPGSLNRHARDR